MWVVQKVVSMVAMTDGGSVGLMAANWAYATAESRVYDLADQKVELLAGYLVDPMVAC